MQITIWGSRGSIPTPLSGEEIENKIRKVLRLARPGDISSAEAVDSFIRSLPVSMRGSFGGNTSSIQVDTDSGELLIIDCGSGLRAMGLSLMKGDFGRGRGTGSVFLTHTHWDHIQGIPFFVPIYIPGNRFDFYSSMSDLQERIEYQQKESHFPKPLEYMAAQKNFFRVPEEEFFYLNDLEIYLKKMPHPGGASGIRIKENGKVFVYTSDCEFNIDQIDTIDEYRELFIDADIVIFDTQYTFTEAYDKIDWGHSTSTMAIDIGGKFNVKHLIMFHHDPGYDDEKIERELITARTYMGMNPRIAGKMKIDIAREGMVLKL